MHIGMIHFANRGFPPDIRIEKEAIALSQNGYKVTILTEKISDDEPAYEQLGPNYYVRRMKIKKRILILKLRSAINLVRQEYFEPISTFISEDNPDILHVHDLNRVPTSLIIARKYNIPVVADLHENMPAALAAFRTGDPFWERAARSVVFNYQLWRYHEKQSLEKCARVVIVVPEAAKRLYEYGIPESKITIVSNTEDETTFNASIDKCDPDILSKYKSQWMISYIGGIGPHRGWDTVIKAIPLLRNQIPGFKLVLVGANPKQRITIEKMVKTYGVQDRVEIIGWLPFDKINSYIFASKVCLVPHNDFEHTQTTVPHKLFQYMICAKPVLVSDCAPLARIVHDSDAGFIFKADDPESFARKLSYMHQHPEASARKGLSGRKAALGPYAWQHDAKRLCVMYDELSSDLSNMKKNDYELAESLTV